MGDEDLAAGGENWILETFDKEELAVFSDWLDIGDEREETGPTDWRVL